jgi:hypothetical protein
LNFVRCTSEALHGRKKPQAMPWSRDCNIAAVQHEPMTERVRNLVVMIYMVGNALTFTKLMSVELAGLQGAGQLGGKIVTALLLSFVWPLYWIGRTLFG